MGHTKYVFNVDFFKKDTPQSFYVAGFLAADGWLVERKDKRCNSISYIVGLSLKEEDKPHLEKIQKIMSSNHALYKRLVKNSNRNSSYKDSVTYSFQIISKELFNDLKRFNLEPNKSLTYKFPEYIKNHKYVNHFLLGYFDGDGSIGFNLKNSNGTIRKTPQARLHLRGTIDFLYNFNDIVYEHCNLKKKCRQISNDSGIGSLQYVGNNNVKKIMRFLYQNTNIYMDRKKNKYDYLMRIQNGILS